MKRTHSSSSAQYKDLVREKRAIMREFVGKSGRPAMQSGSETKP
jgi:hypothetical protein